MPTRQEIQEYRYIHIFGDKLKQPEIWSFNRSSVAKGIAIGIFCAFLPMPFETVPAVFLAALMGANLPCAIAGVWISNPFTWIPLYTPCYALGSYLIGIEQIPLDQISVLQFGWHYVALWLGCLIIGTSLAICSHFLVSGLWASQIRQRWAERRRRRIEAKKAAANQN